MSPYSLLERMKALIFLCVTDTTGWNLSCIRCNGETLQPPARWKFREKGWPKEKLWKPLVELVKTGCSFNSWCSHSSSFMFLCIWGGGLYIDWQLLNSSWKVLEIKGIILFWFCICKQPQSSVILLHPSVTLMFTRSDAHYFNYV